MDLGEKLKTLRTVYGMTQKEVAEKIGLTIAAYSYYENNLRKPDYKTLSTLTKLFQSSYGYLLDDDEFGPEDTLFDAVFNRYTTIVRAIKKTMDLLDQIDSSIDPESKYIFYLETLAQLHRAYPVALDSVKQYIDVENIDKVVEEYLDDLDAISSH